MIGYLYTKTAILEISILQPDSSNHTIQDSTNAQYRAKKAQIVSIWTWSLNPSLMTTGSVKYRSNVITPDKLPYSLTDVVYYATLERAFYGPDSEYYWGTSFNDHPNNYTGPWKMFYPGGQLYTQYEVQNGIVRAPWTVFYKDGSVKGTHYPFSHGYHVKHIYYGDHIRETGKIINKKKEGIWTTYRIGNRVESKGSYINGEKTGDWMYYQDNGNLKESGTYLRNQRVATWNTYYEDGITLYKTGTYQDNKKTGPWRTYHRNGKLKIGSEYRWDYMDGSYERYDKNGALKECGSMQQDKPVGIWFEFKKSAFVPGTRVPSYIIHKEEE